MNVGFARAYFSPSQSGEDQIVLLSDPIDDPINSAPNGSLTPTTAPPLLNLLCIQLHWRTSSSPKVDTLVANNAVLHWYVYGKPTSTGAAVLHYIGTGSVSVSVDAAGADVSVNHADLKLADHHGNIRDPFGQFEINSTFRATANPSAAKQSLDDVQTAISQADHRGAPASTKP